jgi:XTP/dITP diphosphohydrolase
MNQLVFLTENPGKLNQMRSFAGDYGVEIFSPTEAGFVPVEVDETGETFEANARLKVEAYLAQDAAKDFVICGDDSGIEITALGGEPGVHTRRWVNGEWTSDDGIIAEAFRKLDDITDRSAIFRTVVAYSDHGAPIAFTSGELPGHIAKEVDPRAPITEGVPFQRIFVVDGEPELYLWEFHDLSSEKRVGRYTHRETAFRALFDVIKEKANG